MIALISDIHANLAAFQAVLKDIEEVGNVERIYCLGDVVGYGPKPVECLELAAQKCSVILMGNHEHAVLHGPYLFNPRARKAIEWTKEALEEVKPARRKELWDLLENLPVRHQMGDVLLVHGSPRDPVMEYVLESDVWEGSDPYKMEEIFSEIGRLCFVGHSHRPGIFTEDRCFLPSGDIGEGFDVGDGNKYLINVGSVGQPRDKDPRACYALYTGDAIYFRRVEYAVEETAQAIRGIEALGDHLADRLFRGE